MSDIDGYRPPPPWAPPSLRADPLGPVPAPPASPTSLPRPRARRAFVVLVAAVGAAAVAVALLTVHRTTSLRRLDLPNSVGNFRLLRALDPGEVLALARGGSLAGFGLSD